MSPLRKSPLRAAACLLVALLPALAVPAQPMDAQASAELAAVEALGDEAAVSSSRGDARASLLLWTQALERMQSLAQAQPANRTVQMGLARSHLIVGETLLSLGSSGEARWHFDTAARIQDEGINREGSALWLLERAQTHDSLAGLHLLVWNSSQALAEAQAALSVLTPLSELGLERQSREMMMSPHQVRLAQVMQRQAQWDDAHAILTRQELLLLTEISSPEPATSARGRLLWVRELLGENLRGRGVWAGAEIQFRLALEMAREDLALEPDDIGNRNSVAWYLYLWGRALRDLGREVEARTAWEEGRQLLWDPLQAVPLENISTSILDTLAQILLIQGRVEEARPVVERLLGTGWCMGDFVVLCQQTGLLGISKRAAARPVPRPPAERPL